LATRDDIEEILNQRLGRDEFMPFAPSILEEYADQYLEKYAYSPFMVETFNVKPKYLKKFPPIIHIDNTLRPQIVRRSVSPGYWEIIKRVGDQTGYYLVLNTSYNIHGEPIVCSPDDALNTFEHGATDYLALGNWLLKLEPQDIKKLRQYQDEG
jgi:carbamoyltransferase